MDASEVQQIYDSMKVYGPSYAIGRDGWWMDTVDAIMAAGFSRSAAEAMADVAAKSDKAATLARKIKELGI